MMQRFAMGLACLIVGAQSTAASSPPFERTVLENGAVLIVSEQRNLPLVTIEISVDAGSRRDPKGREGLANLTADLLNEGTRSRGARALAEEVDRMGARLSTAASVDAAELSIRVLSRDLDQAIDLLSDILLRPAFAAAELERRREAVLAGMRAAEDQPGHLAYRAFIESVYGDEPYGHLIQGTPDAVAALSRADVVAFFEKHYTAQGAIITVVGDVDLNAIRKTLTEKLAGWRTKGAEPFQPAELAATKPAVKVIRKPLSQTNIILGHRGIARRHPDYYPVIVMNHILGGGGFGSRLVDNIRTEGGLAYSVGSAFATPKAPGSFRIQMQTAKASTHDAIARACSELLRIREEGVSEQELSAARKYLTGNFPLQLDSMGKIASLLSSMEFFGLGPTYPDDYLAAVATVTRDDILRVAREHIWPDKLHLVLVGDVDWSGPTPLTCSALVKEEKAS